MFFIPIRYQYTRYPFSVKATRISIFYGFISSGACCLLHVIFWACVVMALLQGIGLPESASVIIALVTGVVPVYLAKKSNITGQQKAEHRAMADLLALRDTDPEAFKEYSAKFWQELHRYQSTYGYHTPYGPSTPPRQNTQGYQAPPVSYTPPQQNTTVRQESAPDVPQPAPQEAPVFDIQEEIPDDIEMPETMPQSIVQEEEIPEMVAETDPVADTAPIQEAPVQAKKFCSKCGTKLKPESAFCHRCGSRL